MLVLSWTNNGHCTHTMAHRQTYHKGPPTPDEYFAIFDFDPADQEPYYYNRRYESHLHQTEQEKSQEIFRLLRSLSERLDAQDSRRAHHLRPHNTDGETAEHQNASTSPISPIETGRPEYAHTTVEEIPSPERRSTMAEKGQPDEASLPAPDTTTSEDLCKPDNQNTLAHRDTYSGPIPMRKDHDQRPMISVEETKTNRPQLYKLCHWPPNENPKECSTGRQHRPGKYNLHPTSCHMLYKTRAAPENA